MTKGAVLVERRGDIDINQVVKNHFRHLGPEWELTVFGTQAVYDKLDFANKFYLIPDHIIQSVADYNLFMTNIQFWQMIEYDKVLIIHPDSMLLRKGIDDFLKWDYVGAPWGHFKHVGGNGGLSIRTREKMIEVCMKVKYDAAKYGNEDLYFSKFTAKFGGNIAPMCEAMKFSVETIFYPEPIGCHAPHKYLTKEQMGILFKDQQLTYIKD